MRRQAGEGTFYFDSKRNKWRYRKPYDWKTLSVYGETKSECIKKMKQKEEEEKRKSAVLNPDAADRRTLEQELEAFLNDLYKSGLLKPKTYDGKEDIFNKYIRDEEIGRTAIINITDRDLQALLNEVAETKSQGTVNQLYTLLSQFFTYYYRKKPYYSPLIGVIKPNVSRLRQRHGEQTDIEVTDDMILNDEEIEKVVQYCYGQNHYYYYVYPVLIFSMLRYGEMLGLTWEDITDDYMNITKSVHMISDRENPDKHYRWDEDTPKTKSGRRKIYITPELQDALDHYREITGNPDSGYLLLTKNGKPVDGALMRRKLTKVIRECGIKKHITLHRLRHTGASYYIRHNGNIAAISKQLGHANLSITLRVYYHILTEEQKRIYSS